MQACRAPGAIASNKEGETCGWHVRWRAILKSGL